MEGDAVRHISFDPDALTDPAARAWWDAWRIRSDAATARVLQAWKKWRDDPKRPPAFDHTWEEDVWKDVKVWLLEHVFHYKCAYCESPLDLDRYFGDAEHFRPKGNVTVPSPIGPKRRATSTLDGAPVDHPGYFWLAYHWRNLMPACSFCNSKGKNDLFPTAKPHAMPRALNAAEEAALIEPALEYPAGSRTFYLGPQMLDAIEEPLLLSPFTTVPARQPSKHLRYGVGGKVVAIGDSPLGKESIRTYKLDSGRLERRRQKAQEAVQRLYFSKLQNTAPALFQAVITQALQPFVDGEEDYATAALHYIEELQQAQVAAALRLQAPQAPAP
jgi:hypothetical protein